MCYHQVVAIRAIQGHSGGATTPLRLRTDCVPVTYKHAEYIWHGTNEGCYSSIMELGIIPGGPADTEDINSGSQRRRPHRSSTDEKRTEVFFSSKGHEAYHIPLSERNLLPVDQFGHFEEYQTASYYHRSQIYMKIDVRKAQEEYGIEFRQMSSLAIASDQTIPSDCIVECLTRDGMPMSLTMSNRGRRRAHSQHTESRSTRRREHDSDASRPPWAPSEFSRSAAESAAPAPATQVQQVVPPPPPAPAKGFTRGKGAGSRGAALFSATHSNSSTATGSATAEADWPPPHLVRQQRTHLHRALTNHIRGSHGGVLGIREDGGMIITIL